MEFTFDLQFNTIQVTHGFSNWKDGTIAFHKHKKSACHSEAVEIVVTLPATTKNVGELLSRKYAVQKLNDRQALYKIMKYICFLSRQGLALRGNKDESDCASYY